MSYPEDIPLWMSFLFNIPLVVYVAAMLVFIVCNFIVNTVTLLVIWRRKNG